MVRSHKFFTYGVARRVTWWMLAAVAVALAPSHIATAASITLNSSADTYITEYSALGGPDSNHGSDTRLWSEGFQPDLTIPLVRFDLSAYSGQTVVGSPTVRLYLNDAGAQGDAVTQTIDARQSLVSWQESTVTWNNFGGSGYQDSDGSTLSTQVVNFGADKFSYVSWSIPTSVVQSWIGNGSTNYGLIFRGSTPVGSSDLLFSSREGGNAPQLVFETAASPEPTSLCLLGLGSLGLLGRRRK